MKNQTKRGVQKGITLISLAVFVSLFVFAGSSIFADSRDNRNKSNSAKRSCPIKCPPVKNAKDIRRHAACMARRNKVCR